MAPAADAVRAVAETIEMSPPAVPLTSNVHGGWASQSNTSAETWAQHVVGTVRFAENVETIMQWAPSAIVEVGPGSTLCSLIGKVLGEP